MSVRKHKLGVAQLQEISHLFAVLSEPTRLRILQLLRDGPASVGQIVKSLRLKQANASKQLGILLRAGILDRKKNGNSAIYSIRMPLVMDLCDLVCDGLQSNAAAKAKVLAGRRDSSK